MAAQHQTRYDILATNLLFAGLLLSVISSFLLRGELNRVPSKVLSGLTLQVIIGLSTLLVLAHYYFIRKGYRWAKLLFFILTGLNVLFLLLDYRGVAAKTFTSPLKIAGFVVQWLLQTAACVLLVISYRNTRWSSEQASTTTDVQETESPAN